MKVGIEVARITITLDSGKSLNLTVDEAKELHGELSKLIAAEKKQPEKPADYAGLPDEVKEMWRKFAEESRKRSQEQEPHQCPIAPFPSPWDQPYIVTITPCHFPPGTIICKVP